MRRIAALVVAVFAAGCMVGPKYHRPPIAGTPAFKEAPPEGWKEAEPNEGLPRGRWWEIYNNPQLNELVSKVEDPADYEMLGMCHVVVGNEAGAGAVFRAALAIERERNAQSDLCGSLMKRVSML